jgi:hypothetical protein
MSNSPYLSNHNRLADVIAAIQVMATYKFYKMDYAGWADRITGEENTAFHWREVFEQHPEFFRLDSKKKMASLVWRRQHQKLFDVDNEDKISRDEYLSLAPAQKERISRMPLESDEIAMLIKAAIDLHSRELEHKKDSRWWVTILMASALSLFGVALGAYIKS